MQKKLHFFIVDDDESTIAIYKKLLSQAGHRVDACSQSKSALELIKKAKPDCIICDLIMPEQDGFELLKQVRSTPFDPQPKFIIITTKNYDFDRRHAFELGVDGYFTKPINVGTFAGDVVDIAQDAMNVSFYGVRGTLPRPGRESVRYGGNTNCVTLSIAKKHFFIFDAGTGIKSLGDQLIINGREPVKANIFITHPHYDHINGIPFFAPLYKKGNEFHIFGPYHAGITVEQLIGKQMDSIYFPVTMKEFSANLIFSDLKEESIMVDHIPVKTILLNHPGSCLGYRVDYHDKSFCYITDNELFPPDTSRFNQHDDERLIEFIHGADMVIIDATYTDEEYPMKVGWGHSNISRVVEVADKAKVKLLCLFHHDPSQTDKDIDAKVKKAKALLNARKSKTHCIAPREGDTLSIK